MHLDSPRSLSGIERAVLAGQAGIVTVVGRCGCGCPTIDLETDMDPDVVDAVRLHRLELVYYGDPPPSGRRPAHSPRARLT